MSQLLAQPPVVVTRAAQPYLGIRQKVTMSTISQLAHRIPELFGWLAAHGTAPTGAPFFRYHVIDMERELDVEIGLPVEVPVVGDGTVSAGELPAGRYLTAPYIGAPDQLVMVTWEFLQWAQARDLRWDAWDTPEGQAWGGRVEFYETDPAVEPDPTKWTTVLAFKLAD